MVRGACSSLRPSMDTPGGSSAPYTPHSLPSTFSYQAEQRWATAGLSSSAGGTTRTMPSAAVLSNQPPSGVGCTLAASNVNPLGMGGNRRDAPSAGAPDSASTKRMSVCRSHGRMTMSTCFSCSHRLRGFSARGSSSDSSIPSGNTVWVSPGTSASTAWQPVSRTTGMCVATNSAAPVSVPCHLLGSHAP